MKLDDYLETDISEFAKAKVGTVLKGKKDGESCEDCAKRKGIKLTDKEKQWAKNKKKGD